MDPDENCNPDWELAKVTLDEAVRKFVAEANLLGVYMPGLATYLRLHADELAEKHPDDINGGSATPTPGLLPG